MDPTLAAVVSWLLFFFGSAAPLYVALVIVGLGGFMEVTRFENYDTLFYRLNPVSKIALTVSVTVLAATTIWWIGLLAAAFILAMYSSLKDGRRKIALGIMIAFTTCIGALWSYAPRVPVTMLASAGLPGMTVLWTFPDYFGLLGYQHVLTLQAVYYGLQIGSRITSTLLMSLILVMTSTPSAILKAVNKIGFPITITFMLVVAMRSVTRIFQAIDTSVKVQRMRGLGSGAPKRLRQLYYIKGALASIVPVMVHLLRGANTTSLSADTRGFRAFPKRTYMDPIVLTRADYVGLGVAACVVSFAVAANILGFGRDIPYIV